MRFGEGGRACWCWIGGGWLTYGAVACAKAGDAVAGVLPGIFGYHGLEDVTDDVPELVVLVLQKENQTGGLRVERGGDIPDEVGDDLLNAVVGDGRGLVESVDAAAVGQSVEEVEVGGHGGLVCGEACWCGGEGADWSVGGEGNASSCEGGVR